MIQLTPQTRILIARDIVDFRKGIDSLVGLCKNQLQEDPFSGAVFIFRNRRFQAIKILVYDGQGYWLMQKRLSQGRYSWWPDHGGALIPLSIPELQMLIWNGKPKTVQFAAPWKKL